VEAALSHTIKLEAFKQSLAYQGTLVNRVLPGQLQFHWRQVRLPHSTS